MNIDRNIDRYIDTDININRERERWLRDTEKAMKWRY